MAMAEISDDDFCESGSCTQFEAIKLRYSWIVNDFSLQSINKYKLISPEFSSESYNDNSQWCLMMQPGINNGLPCQLKLITLSNMVELYAYILLYVVNSKGEIISTVIRKTYLFQNNTVCDTRGLLKPLKSFWDDDDTFTIVCEINYMVQVHGENISSKTCSKPLNSLAIDFTFLLENKELSDVTLCAGGKEFPAHRVILAARSSVFRAMFQHDMEESRNNRVEITDVEEEDLCEMLRYMYTGKVNKLETNAPQLLGIADKYAMEDFKIICEKALIKMLSFENVVEYFILSDMFHATELKNRVKKFIVSHAPHVANSPEFQAMVRTHPHLGIEACCVISNKLGMVFN